MGQLGAIIRKIKGEEPKFDLARQAFHQSCALSGMALLVGILVGYRSENWELSALLIGCLFISSLGYWLSRFRNKFGLAMFIFATVAYLTIVTCYFFTQGANGSAGVISLLTLILFYASSKSKTHWIWTVLHVVTFTSLLAYEFFSPDQVIQYFPNDGKRFVQVSLVYAVVILFTFLTFRLIKKSYEKQRDQLDTAKRNLEHTNDNLRKILSVIGHDVRNPLASIELFLEIILDDTENLDDELNSLKKELQATVRFTAVMLDDVTKWSKEQVHGQKWNFKSQHLGSWLDETVGGLNHLSKLLGVELVHNYDSDSNVFCDEILMTIIIRNLVQNAIKFTPAGKKVYLNVSTTDNHHQFEIIDEGTGMNEQQLSNLFTSDSTSSLGVRQEKGIGLGLLLVKEYTDAHRGIIEAKSQVSKGTKIVVKIPLANPRVEG